MKIIKRNTPNKSAGRSGQKPDIIVCHITEGAFDGAVSWLCNLASQASSHFVIARDGRVTQLVELTDTAWCNGTTTTATDGKYHGKSNLAAVRERKTNANYYTISIEYEGICKDTQGALTVAQLDAAVELIKHIRAEVKRLYGIEIPIDRQHIVGHCDITPQWKPNCPGPKYPYNEVIRRVIEAAAPSDTTAHEATSTLRRGDSGEAVRTMQSLLNAAGTAASLSADASFGPATETALKAFQQANGLSADGVCGPKTWAALLEYIVSAPETPSCGGLQASANPDKTPAEITVDNLLSDGVITDPSHWLGYLNGEIATKTEWVKAIFDRYHTRLAGI